MCKILDKYWDHKLKKSKNGKGLFAKHEPTLIVPCQRDSEMRSSWNVFLENSYLLARDGISPID